MHDDAMTHAKCDAGNCHRWVALVRNRGSHRTDSTERREKVLNISREEKCWKKQGFRVF